MRYPDILTQVPVKIMCLNHKYMNKKRFMKAS